MEISQHTSQQYNQELEEVRNHVLQMGGLVEEQLANALKALQENNSDLASRVASEDHRVNELEVSIDEECATIIARRQPAAVDLRLVIAIIKSITDLERIGDEAKKIARYAAEISGGNDGSRIYRSLHHMGDHVRQMLNDALDAVARMDAHSAMNVAEMDREIDEEFNAVSRQLITLMMEDPRNIKHSLNVIWCARALERIGDHCVNLCEYVVYLVNGKDVRHLDLDEIRAELTSKNPTDKPTSA